MATRLVELMPEEKLRLRELDAKMRVAESGHPGWTPDECAGHIITYGEFLEHLHVVYELDENEFYTFDSARGYIFEGFLE